MRGEVMTYLDDLELSPINLAREPAFQIGDVQIHPATRQITRLGRSETLEPRVMQVLIAFARAEGEILSRDDLIARCWSGQVVGDNAIHRVVSKVRSLGLNFGGGAFQLETITKVGYRMIVASPVGFGKEEIDLTESNILSVAHIRPSRRMLIGSGLVAVGAAAAVGLWKMPSRNDVRVSELLAASEQAMRAGLPHADSQGIGFLEEAEKLQPDNALVLGRLALARSIASEYASPTKASDLSQSTQEAARRALILDPQQVDARGALALLPPYFGDWLTAEKRMEAVLATDHGHLPTRDALSFLKAGVGRGREGSLDRISFAPLDRLHAVYQFKLIYAYWLLGEIGEADRTADRALQLWPMHPAVWFGRLWTLAFTGRADRALLQVEDEATRPNLPKVMSDMLKLAMNAMLSGRDADADRTVGALRSLAQQNPTVVISAVLILNGLGRLDEAYDFANAYLLEQGPLMASVRWRPGQLSVNDQRRRKTHMLFVPVSAPMRTDPRFATLVDAVGLSKYWDQRKITPDYMQS